MPAWTQCTVTPQGAGRNDPRIDAIQADEDGEARFSPPPSTWGTKLLLNCTLNGTSSQYLVDLNDSSTFRRESGSDLAPRPNGTLPALTGDLSAISQDDLVQQGYLPRPAGPIGSPAYNQWVASVSKPTIKFMPVGVEHLGVYNYGTYKGTVSAAPWNAGIEMATAGFPLTSLNPSGTSYPTSNSQLFNAYQFVITVPYYYGCSSGTCATSIWGGIGGSLITGTNGQLITPTSSLIQSGWEIASNQSPNIQLMWEYFVTGSSNSPNCGGFNTAAMPPGSFSSGDQILMDTYAVTSSACTTLAINSAPWACYYWEDTSVNPYVIVGPKKLQVPSCSGDKPNWIPTTWEFAAEVSGGGSGGGYRNANYGDSEMVYGSAGDYTGNWHADPGNPVYSGDPYLYFQTNASSGDVLSNGIWFSGYTWDPVDPFSVFWDNNN